MCTIWFRTAGSYRLGALVTFIVAVTLCACTVFLLITLTEPALDDFCRAHFDVSINPWRSSGTANATIRTYLNWSGRWAGLGLDFLVLSAAPLPDAYPWLMFTLIVVQYLILYLAIWNLVKDACLALYFSALVASVYWATMPGPEEGIFWFTGAVENQSQLVLVALLFSFALSHSPTLTTRSTRFPTIAASGLGFVTPAFHELVGGVLVLALSAITVRAFLFRSSDRKIWLTVWAASVLGFLVVFVAPGNFGRMHYLRTTVSDLGSPSGVVRETSRTVYHYIMPWCLDFKHWLLAIVIWFDPGVAAIRAKFSGMSSFRAIAGFALIWFSSIIIMVGVSIYLTGLVAPWTMNLVYGVFLMGWIVLAFLLTQPHPRFPVHPAHRITTLSLALFLLSMLVATSNNTLTGIRDIASGVARSWNAELNRRFAVLKAAGRDADVILPPISASPRILRPWSDITQDPDFFANQCVAKYFGVASVRISDLFK